LTKKTKDKQRPYNGQKRQRTNTGHTIDRKDKGQTQAIQWTEKKMHKHRPYNGKKRQSTNTGHTMNKKDKDKHRRYN
jgi:hypothetical protein